MADRFLILIFYFKLCIGNHAGTGYDNFKAVKYYKIGAQNNSSGGTTCKIL